MLIDREMKVISLFIISFKLLIHKFLPEFQLLCNDTKLLSTLESFLSKKQSSIFRNETSFRDTS